MAAITASTAALHRRRPGRFVDTEDPYWLDETTFTREEILCARGMTCARQMSKPRLAWFSTAPCGRGGQK